MVDDDRSSMALVDYHYDTETPTSIAVIRTIAAVENYNPTDLVHKYDHTLYDSVDPDALNRLADCNGGDPSFEVSFTLYGYHIEVQDNSRILLYELE